MSYFRTIEVSDPRFAHEGLRHVTVKSPALKARGDITMWIPEAGDGKAIPLVLLLHGVYGSHWAWALKAGAHRTAKRLIEAGEIPAMMLAMPSDGLWGDGSGYVPHQGQDFEKWIVEDVPAAARIVAGEVTLQDKFFLCGLSMGGYGALRLGAKYPALCAGISGHSSITEASQMKAFVGDEFDDFVAPSGGVLESILKNRAVLPPLRFDCGKEDSLIEENRLLHDHLTAARLAHVYEEFPGGHEWPYWEKHLEDSLRFFSRQLR